MGTGGNIRLAQLLEELQQKKVLKSAPILMALKSMDRADFVPSEYRQFAYADTALPIGNGQTISQPYTVVFMLELLQVVAGNFVMDVGHGSAWQTGLLASLVGENGAVFAFEVVPSLCVWGKDNLKKFPEIYKRVSFFCQNAKNGVPGLEDEKLDRIISAAELKRVPLVWRKQLKPGGIMVYPIGGGIRKETKTEKGGFIREDYSGFAFVPFLE